MYVSLNLDQMVIHHLHPDVNIVSMLAYLECDSREVVEVFDIANEDFERFTWLELETMYRKLTGTEPNFQNDELRARAMVLNAIDGCTTSRCSLTKLEVQCDVKDAWLAEQKGKHNQPKRWFRYNPRGESPLDADEDMPPAITAVVNNKRLNAIEKGDYALPKLETQAFMPKHEVETAPTVRKRRRAPTSGPTRKKTEIAQELLTGYWEELGKPSCLPPDFESVVARRASEQEVSARTVSNELWHWRKNYLPNI